MNEGATAFTQDAPAELQLAGGSAENRTARNGTSAAMLAHSTDIPEDESGRRDGQRGHLLAVEIRGAGTGTTSYVVSCTCGWRHEDYSAMSAYDRATLHELRAGA